MEELCFLSGKSLFLILFFQLRLGEDNRLSEGNSLLVEDPVPKLRPRQRI